MDRADIVHENFLKRVEQNQLPAGSGRGSENAISLEDAGLSRGDFTTLVHAQFLSRQLDRTSRKMQAQGQGFYTIGSSGHEGNAAIANAFRVNDMAFLHYRDAAFLIQRAAKAGGIDIARDMILSFAASSEDPISGGRHKVLGSKALFIPPQTSTIASHLPKAMGAAFSIGLARQLKPELQTLADDGIVLCSFGDASLNHSTAQGAINTASWTAYQGSPMPIVFICEDNGIGISTKTPHGWVEASMRSRPGIKYVSCNGLDLVETHKTAREVEAYVRQTRKPVFLHVKCVRLFGHAGADVQAAYLSNAEIEATEANDPLLHTARLAIDHGIMTAGEVTELYNEIGNQCESLAADVSKTPRLKNAREVMASLVPPKRKTEKPNRPSKAERDATFKSDLAQMDQPQHMAKLLNWALTDLMLEHPEIIMAGEDIGPKGGVYGVTQRLHQRFGPARMINTLLDEQSILGLSIGMAHNGFIPVPEIQFLAYLHNAEDQLRGEAATLSFFSDGQFTNPMVIRIAGLGYQKGIGGHFHNDNSLAVLRDIPGVVIACPSNGRDAVSMMRESVRLAREENRIVVFVEPIALYMTRDLHEEKDGKWTFPYERPGEAKPDKSSEVTILGDGNDLAILTYGNGLYLSRKAEPQLTEKTGLKTRIIDLRWLAPLNMDAILNSIGGCKRVLIVDECRITGSQSEGLMALLYENWVSEGKKLARYAAEDSFIPLGPAANATLPSVNGIIQAAIDLTNSV